MALPINACAERLGYAPHERHPLIRCAHPAAVTPLRSVSLLARHPGFAALNFPRSGAAPEAGSRACKISIGSNSVASAFLLLLLSSDHTGDAKSPSGGRVESPRKGLSDMDVAKATMGQGWPFVAGPWSGDGRREPRRSRGRMSGCPSLWLLSLGQARESDSPVRGETRALARRVN